MRKFSIHAIILNYFHFACLPFNPFCSLTLWWENIVSGNQVLPSSVEGRPCPHGEHGLEEADLKLDFICHLRCHFHFISALNTSKQFFSKAKGRNETSRKQLTILKTYTQHLLPQSEDMKDV